MNIKNFAFIALFFIGLTNPFTSNTLAQKEMSEKPNSPPIPERRVDVILTYIDLLSLPIGKTRKGFVDLSEVDRSDLFRFHLAFQLANRPNLSNAQQDLILESLSVASSDAYDKTKDKTNLRVQTQTLEERIKIVFSKQEAIDIFANLKGTSEDLRLLKKYQDISNISTVDDRRDFFRNLSAADKSNLWRIHLAYSLVRFPELNSEQQRVVLQTIEIAVPELFEAATDSPERNAKIETSVKPLQKRIHEAFSKGIGMKVFLVMGNDPTSESLLAAQCNCSIDSIPACWDEYCPRANCHRTSGCGVLWLWECDGRCLPR